MSETGTEHDSASTFDESDSGEGRLAAMYFMCVATVFLSTYLPRYLEGLGISAGVVGLIFSARSALGSLANPAWAQLADRLGSTRGVLRLQLGLGLCAAILFVFARSPWWIGVTLIGIVCTFNTSLPILDTITLRRVGGAGFGRLRSWGSVGFGSLAVGVAVLGGVLGEHGRLSEVVPWLLLVLVAGAATLTLGIPPAPVKRDDREDTPPPLTGREIWAVLTRRRVLWVLGLGVLHWVAMAPYNLFFVSLAESRGTPAWVPGAAVGLGVACEVVLMRRGESLIARLGAARLLVGSFALTAARWAATSLALNTTTLIVLQSVHGVSFGVFYIATVALLTREVPDALRATGQACIYLVIFGLGGAIGNALMGRLKDTSDAATLFAVAAGIEALAALLGVVALRRGGLGSTAPRATSITD